MKWPLKSIFVCGLAVFQLSAFAQNMEEVKETAVLVVTSVFDEFQLQLGTSALNPERSATSAINLNISGAAYTRKSENGKVSFFPYSIKAQYQLKNKDQNVPNNLLMERVSLHMLEVAEKWNANANIDMEIDVKIMGHAYEEFSWATRGEPEMLQSELQVEIINAKPKLTIYLNQDNREIFFQIRGEAAVAMTGEAVDDRQTYYLTDADVMTNINSRGGLEKVNVLYGGGGASFKVALGFLAQIKNLNLAYQYQHKSYNGSTISVIDRGSYYTEAEGNVWTKQLQGYNNYSTHQFSMDYKLNNKSALTSTVITDGSGKLIYSGVGLKLNLFNKKKKKY